MKRSILLFSIILLAHTSARAQVVITEVLYNAQSSETTTATQYIELANTSNAPVSLDGWTLDDEDSDGPNSLSGVTIPAFGVVVFTGSSTTDFNAAWNNPGCTVTSLGTSMINFSNSPTLGSNEIIELRDGSSTLIDQLNYDDDGTIWPLDDPPAGGGLSIYLNLPDNLITAVANDNGTNWANSATGVNGAYSSTPFGVWNAVEVGSPCLVNGDAVLPVELVSFTAQTEGQDVLLQWATASETGNAGFEVQHRREETFQPVGFVAGYGTTTVPRAYQYRLAGVQPGRHTFRLKQVDLDGTVAYSPEVEVTVELAQAYALGAAYPNPFNPQAQFEVTVRETQPVTVTLYNLLGQAVAELYRGVLAANVPQTVQIDGRGLASGVYVYRVQGTRFLATKTVTLAK
jgi:hypothetical protein